MNFTPWILRVANVLHCAGIGEKLVALGWSRSDARYNAHVSYTKRIVCLANSRKPPTGRCIAGRELLSNGFGDWIRPVSGRPTREVSEDERRYEDGSDPHVLDIIDIPLVQHSPEHHQHENHVLNEKFYWAKRGVCPWNLLLFAVEEVDGPLWVNGFSSANGLNDRVPTSHLHRIARSLYLIRPDELVIAVAREESAFASKRRVRACFTLGGEEYRVAVTDPLIEREYLRRGDGEIDLTGAIICMSLGEVFHGYAYKLVASVIIEK